MANIKKYVVEHEPTCGEIRIEIDFDFVNHYGDKAFTMDEWLKELVEFWSGADFRLKENNDNYLHTFLKYLCPEVLSVQIEFNRGVSAVIKQFENREGWCALDGSAGIKLTSVDGMEFSDQEAFRITEL